MGFWIFMYKKPHEHPRVTSAELAYIQQDDLVDRERLSAAQAAAPRRKMSFAQAFKYRQTWAFAAGKFMTDGVWWFFLFWKIGRAAVRERGLSYVLCSGVAVALKKKKK